MVRDSSRHQRPSSFGEDEEAMLDEALSDALEGFANSENQVAPDGLCEFLPSGSPQLQRFVLLELIKLQMAMTAEAGHIPSLAPYFDALSDWITPDSVPLDLVMEEIQLRNENGDNPEPGYHAQRFPQFASVLGQWLDSAEATSPSERIRPPVELEEGRQINDFEIIRMLGKGAFAHVYLAKQVSMSRLVALKVSSGTGDEPRALAQFDHPNIVRVYDQKRVEDPDVHLLYMQFHPGGTLSDLVKSVCVSGGASSPQRPGLPGQAMLDVIDRHLIACSQIVPDRSNVRAWIQSTDWPRLVAWIGIQLAEALDEAHRRGVLHRDVKPANVLLTAEGIPQLADFNVSFAGAAGRAGAASSLGGTIGYMSPEHLRAISPSLADGQESEDETTVAEQADLYSLAVLLWELWQGSRPFVCGKDTYSWTGLLEAQYHSRNQPLVAPLRQGSASERVLESALRKALATNPNQRPPSGSEMAGDLRLAMHPEAAKLFDPPERSLPGRLMLWSPWWLATVCILLPNIAAGMFNFEYNSHEIMQESKEALQELSIWVNSIAFPVAVCLMIGYTRALVKALHHARTGMPVTAEQIDSTLDLGHRAAMIGGGCWIIAGMVYPLMLRLWIPDFSVQDAAHFFLSLLICGGVAMIYPLFSLGLLTAYVYYPQMIRSTMRDPNFDKNAERMISRCESYFMIAVIIPLLGAALMVSGQSQSRGFMLIAIAAGVAGLLASFFANRAIARAWRQMAPVLSRETSIIKRR